MALITFETISPGPSTFYIGLVAQTRVFTNYQGSGINITFTGGVILTNTTNLPVNQSNVYGTAKWSFGDPDEYPDPSLANPITVTFSQPITNFFLDVYNGLLIDSTYRLSDNAGHSKDFTLVPNLSGGTTQIGFAATGTVVTITGLTVDLTNFYDWDFFIDNIHFNEALPASPSPTGGIIFSNPTKTDNFDTYYDKAEAIPDPTFRTGYIGSSPTGDNIMHFTAVRTRVIGNGNLQMTLYSLSDINKSVLVPLAMNALNALVSTRLCNFTTQYTSLEGKTIERGEFLKINRLILYIKEVGSELPG